MNRKHRFLKRSIFIACEGQTEEFYFRAIGEEINENPKYSVKVQTLEIENGTPQDPVGLVKEAAKIRDGDGYDEAWAVFDKDREPNHQIRRQAFQDATRLGIQIAYSSIAFEHWILLHFEKNLTSFSRCDCSTGPTGNCLCKGQTCVTTYLKLRHFQTYKKASYKLYTQLSTKNSDALENAAWLKFMNRGQLSQELEVTDPYQLNPHSDVDSLLIRLLDLKKVLYSRPKFPLILNGKAFNVLSLQPNSLMLTVSNGTETAYVVNNQSGFLIRDSNGQLHQPNIANAVLVNPGDTTNVNLTYHLPPDHQAIELRLVQEDKILIFGLAT